MAGGTGEGRRGIRLTDTQRIAWLRLIRSDNVGPVTFRELINHFGSAEAALDALPSLAARGGRPIRIASSAEAEREIRALERLGGGMVALGEPDYPPWLRQVDDAPPLLSYRGAPGALTEPMVAIVGSRNASVAGRKIASMIASGLGAAGYTVASGLARGIDAAAHEASLATGTVAVLAGGLDRVYPEDNAPLAERIVEAGGTHITEMPLGHAPRGRDFPRRNRIVSGLALGVVIVEAAQRSGSLITARRAADQGRIVFAVPGSPLDPRAYGTNRLIRDGAILVTDAEEVVEALRPMRKQGHPEPPDIEEEGSGEPVRDADDSDRARIIEALGPAPVEIDAIVRFTGLRPATVHLVLLELDLAGRLERHSGQRVSLV
jgi:DNA processing protein